MKLRTNSTSLTQFCVDYTLISPKMFKREATKHCCWGTCHSDSRYPDRLPEGTFFVRFPKPGKNRDNMTEWEKNQARLKTEKAKRWQFLCGRKDFQQLEQIKKDTYICSLHFIGGINPTDPEAEPVLATLTAEESQRARKRKAPTPQKFGRKELMVTEDLAGSSFENICEGDTTPKERSVFPKEKRIKKPSMNPDFVPSVSFFHKNKKSKQCNMTTDGVPRKKKKEVTSCNPKETSSNTTLLAGKDVEIEWPDLSELSVQHRQLQDVYLDLQSEVDTLSAKNERLREDLQRVLPRFSYSSIKGDNEQVHFLTGLHPLLFDWLLSQVTDKIDVLPELASRDHLLLTLMKVKLGLCDADLAYRFGIRESSVTRICRTWLPTLAAKLKPLIAWPSANVVSESSPSVFKGKFRNCRCVIDFPEFVVARVGENERKSESTVRYLASVTPAGVVSFLSSGYSGTTLERRIIKESGFLRLLEPQDEMLANGQISIRDELASRQVVLHTPEPDEEKETHKLDSEKQLWTHVTKVIGWWKKFNMLQKVIPEPYVDLLGQVLIICAALTNVNMSIAPKDNSPS